MEQGTFAEIIKLHAMGFRQNAITIFRWCIIAPLSPSRVFALVRFLRFSPALNQQIQLLLNRFALEDEGQQTGLSQEKFALTIGMDRTYYSSVESGKRNISLLNIKKLADGFGIPVADLFPKNMLDEEEDYD